jgi:hypothetical protein
VIVEVEVLEVVNGLHYGACGLLRACGGARGRRRLGRHSEDDDGEVGRSHQLAHAGDVYALRLLRRQKRRQAPDVDGFIDLFRSPSARLKLLEREKPQHDQCGHQRDD